jgi:hypothetical protein
MQEQKKFEKSDSKKVSLDQFGSTTLFPWGGQEISSVGPTLYYRRIQAIYIDKD